jgi:outer membrane protein OmpA-like peptidoglycan-associated protein
MKTTLLIATAVAAALLGGCAAAPVRPSGAAEARLKLTRLQADPNLSGRAPAAIADAAAAVALAEQPGVDPALGDYRVYMADRKIDIATAQAQTRLLEDQRAALVTERQNVRLDARTREADSAHAAAASAQEDAAVAKANAAILAAQAAELQRQIAALDVRETDRGLVLTLGDVLFATGSSDMRSGATAHLDKLVGFLDHYPDRTARIEGYTDSTGSASYNLDLSQRRADSVRGYLRGQGIEPSRLTAAGMGESDPVASNGTASGRQQNRRVEIIISNQAVASR